MLQISDFFTEVKVAKSSDIARNMLPSITMLQKSPLILF